MLGRPYEWLRGDGGDGPGGYAPYPTDVAVQIEIMLQVGSSPNGVCALKMFPEHFDATLGSRWAERMPGLKFVQLIRRDLLGHAISLSIARQTESYAHWMPEQHEAAYSREDIQLRMDQLVMGDARWSLFFARNDIVPLVVFYEDVCTDPQSVVSAVGRHVGVPEATIGTPEGSAPLIQRDGRSREWRARFIAESMDLGILPRPRA